MKKIIYSLLLSFFFAAAALAGEDCIPDAPKPARLVNDFASILSAESKAVIEQALINFNDTTSTQVAIVTVNDLCDYEPSQFAYEIGERWGVGNAKFDNGIVILLKAKQGNQKGRVFIAPGYGLEGVLPDAICKRIVEVEMIPSFKRGDYDGGVMKAVAVIIDIVGGEYSAESYNQSKKAKFNPVPIFFILFFVLVMFLGVFRRARAYSNQNNMGLWASLWLMGSMSGRHRGHYNNFHSGGGGFGGGGGGFGGFGGGSFGGGGAGGSW